MIKILFICHGNICRSPMAEYVMKDMVRRNMIENNYYITSKATSNEEIGNDVHYGTKRKLAEMGIACPPRRAERMRSSDYEAFDYLIGMDSANIRNMRSISGGDPKKKICRLLDFSQNPHDIADPWYTGNFDATYRDIEEGCRCLLEYITSIPFGLFEKIIQMHKLGEFRTEPQRVDGGYMHRMYHLKTTSGDYAVKLLNPLIMKRTIAADNLDRAEALEKKLEEAGLPIVPAITFKGKKRQCIDDQFFYLFHWCKGKTIDWHQITPHHSGIAGKLLAGIQRIEAFKNTTDVPVKHKISWDDYIIKAQDYMESLGYCPDKAEETKNRKMQNDEAYRIYKTLQNNRGLLYEVQNKLNDALEQLEPISCISNEDMDPKNILWEGETPYIIDLECLDYGNPYSHAFQLAMQWSGITICSLNYQCLASFLNSYMEELGQYQIEWGRFYGLSYTWIEWLEYNLKRALGMECNDEEERQMGITQVYMTIDRLLYIKAEEENVLNFLKEQKKRNIDKMTSAIYN